MMSPNWKTGTPRELIADLRPGGWVRGDAPGWPYTIHLHKTELISHLRRTPEGRELVWKIKGNPDGTGRYDSQRRTIVIYLGAIHRERPVQLP